MAIASSSAASIPIPLSALLAPQSHSAPTQLLPSPSAAILGPLPPTTPFHLALNWLALTDLPEYESALSALHRTDIRGSAEDTGDEAAERRRVGKKSERVLIVTGKKDDMYQALQEEDEDWMRDHGSDYEVVHRLKRVDIRYCPSPQHLRLLLSLLTAQTDRSIAIPPGETAFNLNTPPGLVILSDMAGLMMDWEGADENAMPGTQGMAEDGSTAEIGQGAGVLRFKKSVKLSDYLDLVAASISATAHFSKTAQSPTQLIILEPNLDRCTSLPVLPPPTSYGDTDNPSVPASSRQKRIKVIDGLKWMLGEKAIGLVEPYDTVAEDIHAPAYRVALLANPDEVGYIDKKRCGRGEWAKPIPGEGETEGDLGGWRWKWA